MQRLLRRYQNEAGGLLPLLMGIQETLGHIPEADIPEIAQQMNRSVAEVRGVISFYSSSDEGYGPRTIPDVDGDPRLAWHLVESLIMEDFDITIVNFRGY